MPENNFQENYARHRVLWMLSTWLPVVLGLIVIVIESTEMMGSEHTSRFLRPLFEHIFGHVSNAQWEIDHHIIRKSGHFCGYGSLSLLFTRAWYRMIQMKQMWMPRAMMQMRTGGLAIAATFIVACADEYHQTFLPGRTGLFSDALLDTCGATIFQLLLWGIVRLRQEPANPNAGYKVL